MDDFIGRYRLVALKKRPFRVRRAEVSQPEGSGDGVVLLVGSTSTSSRVGTFMS
jgi:hypothetical protein